MAEKTTLSANEAWKRLLEKYPIVETVDAGAEHAENRHAEEGDELQVGADVP